MADARRRSLSLRPGTYAVRGRARDALLDGRVAVAAGLDTVVDPTKLDRTTYAALVRKGKGEILRGVSGPFAGFSAVTAAFYGVLDALPGIVVGWTWVRPSFTLSPRIAAMRGKAGDEEVVYELVTLDMRVTRAWDLGRSSLDLGVGIGGGFFPLGYGSYPAVHVDATLGLNLPLWGRTYLGAEIAAQAVLGARSEGTAYLTPTLFLGVWL
jgi:hypothetical protein